MDRRKDVFGHAVEESCLDDLKIGCHLLVSVGMEKFGEIWRQLINGFICYMCIAVACVV